VFKRILVPLDGSMQAEQALPYAVTLARKLSAKVILMSALAPAERWAEGGASRPEEEAEEKAARNYLQSVSRLADNVHADVRVLWGPAAASICVCADDDAADVIVMTTHGRSGFARWLIGSVSDRVLRTTRKPLVLVHSTESPATAPVEFNRLLVPLDGSGLAEAALPVARELARSLDASVVLERVVMMPVSWGSEAYQPDPTRLIEYMETEARDYLQKTAGVIKDGVEVQTEVSVGLPAAVIIDAAAAHHADMIVLTTHGHSGPARWIMGSVADSVVRHAERPCLIVPTRVAEGASLPTKRRAAKLPQPDVPHLE
jgi:nucleotide-binding universal stress UspA family protein